MAKPDPENPFAQQDPWEFSRWLELLETFDASAYLEIGSCFGHTLRMASAHLCTSLPEIVSVDLGVGVGALEGEDTAAYLRKVAGNIGAHLIIGDSHSQDTLDQVMAVSPHYDACFIDGDHTYEGVKRDWEMYGPLCRMVAFHDIYYAFGNCGVGRFWEEIRNSGKGVVEIRAKNAKYGIGVIFND